MTFRAMVLNVFEQKLLLVVLAKTNRHATSGKSTFEESDSRRSRRLKDVGETRSKDRQSCRQELFEEVCLDGQTEGDYPMVGEGACPGALASHKPSGRGGSGVEH